MKLLKLECNKCGAILKIEPGTNDIKCKYCGANYKFDDEAQHIKYDDMEKAGYDYEKGRLKAKREHEEEKIEAKRAAEKAEKDKKIRILKTIGFILLWVYFLPIMATYSIWKSKKIEKRTKIISIIVIWLLMLAVFITAINTPNDNNTLPEEEQYSSLLGPKEHNHYYEEETPIRHFIITYNKSSNEKITKVQWENNHTKAIVYFDTLKAEITNSINTESFVVKFDFANGKATVDKYDSILKNMIAVLNTGDNIVNIDNLIDEAKNRNTETIELGDSITICYYYTEQQVGYQAPDYYHITLSSKNYYHFVNSKE